MIIRKNNRHHADSSFFLLRKHSLAARSERILDIECGNGYYSAEIAKQMPQGSVIAIASQNDQIKQARDQYAGIKNLSFQSCGFNEFYDTKGFDLVTSLSDLFQYQDKQAVFKRVRRVLKPQGKALFVCYPNDFYWERIQAHSQTTMWKSHFNKFEPEYYFAEPLRYKHFFGVAELEIEDSCFIPGNFTFKTNNDYILYLKSWLPHLKVLPHNLHDLFLSEIADVTTRHLTKTTDHTIQLPSMRLEFLVRLKKT